MLRFRRRRKLRLRRLRIRKKSRHVMQGESLWLCQDEVKVFTAEEKAELSEKKRDMMRSVDHSILYEIK